jgi:hypothetical protein
MAESSARSGPPATVAIAADGRPVARDSWRRTLVAASSSRFTAQFGFAFATPFMALFLSRELGVPGND